jgi:serpin B
MGVRRTHRRAGALAVALGWALTVGACTLPVPEPEPEPEPGPVTTAPPGTVVATGDGVRSAVAREQVPVTEAGPAVEAVAGLAAALYQQVAGTAAGENLVLSPYSIEAALAMVRNGAAGQTRAEMDRVLGTGPGDDLDRALNALDAALAAHHGPVEVGPVRGEIGLRTSNRLWAQQGFVVYATFLDALARHYGARVDAVDFARATEEARTRINTFVSGQTNGRIPEVLPAGAVNGDTRFVLTNTIWFKAPWARPFSAAGDQPFQLGDGSTVAVPTMSVTPGPVAPVLPGGYGEGPGWRAAELPYLGGGLSMVVIVPDDLATFETGLDGPGLLAITGGLGGELQRVVMPRWMTRTSVSLPDRLGALGLRRAFTDGAELSSLSPEPTRIDDVLHQAFIAVDEEGTEAAAATAVIGGPTSIPVWRGAELIVDRPFIYAIRDTETGGVLFLGRVLDPSKGA